jgi:polyisoprenyl-phosphate glycosyltransferase
MDTTPEISIVIPVYNSAEIISELVNETVSVMNASGKPYEIICVDDGSADRSWEQLKVIKQKHSFLRAFRLGKNFGQHKATLCGIMQSRGEWVVTMDDDFEHSPSVIAGLVEKAKEEKLDVLYGVSSKRRKSWLRDFTSRFFKWVSRIENADAGKGSSFRVVSAELVKSLGEHHNHLFFLDEILLWYTDKVSVSTVDYGVSRKKRSGYTYRGLFSLSRNVFMISTTMPLKIVKFIGFSVAGLSFLAGIWYIIHKLIFPTEKGFTSLILSILFSTGLILLCLGIIGEYLGNLLIMQNKKPGYSIREQL